MHDSSLDAIFTDRLARLERENRRVKRLAIGSIAGLTLVALLAAANVPVADILVTKKLVVRDEQGKDRIVLDLGAKAGTLEPRVALLDEAGAERVALTLRAGNEPLFSLKDPTGNTNYRIESSGEGEIGSFIMQDQKIRSLIGISKAGDAGIVLNDGEEVPRIKVAAKAGGDSGLAMQGPDGESRLALESGPDGRVNLGIRDSNGVTRLALGQVGDDETIRGFAKGPDGKMVTEFVGEGLQPGVNPNTAPLANPPGRINNSAKTPTPIPVPVPNTAETLTAQRLVLRDAQGRERLVLTGDSNGGPQIAMKDPEGTDRLTVRLAGSEYSEVQFYDQAGNVISSFSEAENSPGKPFLAMMDENQKVRTQMGYDREEGDAYFGLYDTEENYRALMNLGNNGSAELSLTNSAGYVGVELSVGPAELNDGKVEEISYLSLKDSEGNSIINGMVRENTEGSIAFFDGKGNDIMTLMRTFENNTKFSIFDDKAETRFLLENRPEGYVRMHFYDDQGVERLALGQAADQGAPLVRLNHSDGIIRGAMGQTPDGNAFFTTFRKDGGVIFQGPPLILK